MSDMRDTSESMKIREVLSVARCSILVIVERPKSVRQGRKLYIVDEGICLVIV